MILFVTAHNGFAHGDEAPQTEPGLVDRMDRFLDDLGKPVGLIPDQVKVKMGGEFRYRLELRDDFNFNDATYEDDTVNLFRSRFSLDLTLGPYLRVFA